MTNLTVNNLSYEELVLLQEIMHYINTEGIYLDYDFKTFDSLFEKIMIS
jgi:hypothetical protein